MTAAISIGHGKSADLRASRTRTSLLIKKRQHSTMRSTDTTCCVSTTMIIVVRAARAPTPHEQQLTKRIIAVRKLQACYRF